MRVKVLRIEIFVLGTFDARHHWNMQQLFPFGWYCSGCAYQRHPNNESYLQLFVKAHLVTAFWAHAVQCPYDIVIESILWKRDVNCYGKQWGCSSPPSIMMHFSLKDTLPRAFQVWRREMWAVKNPFLQHSKNTTKRCFFWPGSIYLLPKNFEKSARTQIRRDPMVPLTIATRLGHSKALCLEQIY